MSPAAPRRVCVFCGSSRGRDPRFLEVAADLGRTLAEAGVEVVYGGAHVGLMGAVADAALAAGGTVTGVIPQALAEREVAHTGLTELHVVDSMHARKALMNELSDAFVALPGGLGTLEELFEVWTWAQLGHHAKPALLVDVVDYWSGLLAFLDTVVEQGFLGRVPRDMLLVAPAVADVLPLLSTYEPAGGRAWVDP